MNTISIFSNKKYYDTNIHIRYTWLQSYRMMEITQEAIPGAFQGVLHTILKQFQLPRWQGKDTFSWLTPKWWSSKGNPNIFLSTTECAYFWYPNIICSNDKLWYGGGISDAAFVLPRLALLTELNILQLCYHICSQLSRCCKISLLTKNCFASNKSWSNAY